MCQNCLPPLPLNPVLTFLLHRAKGVTEALFKLISWSGLMLLTQNPHMYTSVTSTCAHISTSFSLGVSFYMAVSYFRVGQSHTLTL